MPLLIEFVLVAIALFLVHEFLHYAIAKALGFPLIALFFVFPLGIAMLTEDDDRKLGQEIVIKVSPTLITCLLAIPFLFYGLPFFFALIIVLLIAGAKDLWHGIKALGAKDLERFFIESEAADLLTIFALKERKMAKIIVFNAERWKQHLLRDNLHGERVI